MKLYPVGPDELSDGEFSSGFADYDWLIYWYEQDGYEGSGWAVGFRKDGQFVVSRLDHCSCYGPLDEHFNGSVYTEQEFFRRKESIHDLDLRDEIMVKARELRGLPPVDDVLFDILG